MKKKKKKLWGSQPDRNGLECLIYYDLFVKFFDFVEFDLIYNSDSASWRLTICYWRINLLVMPSKSSIYQFSDYGDFFSNFRPPSWVHHLESSENTIIFATSSDLKPRPPPPPRAIMIFIWWALVFQLLATILHPLFWILKSIHRNRNQHPQKPF